MDRNYFKYGMNIQYCRCCSALISSDPGPTSLHSPLLYSIFYSQTVDPSESVLHSVQVRNEMKRVDAVKRLCALSSIN